MALFETLKNVGVRIRESNNRSLGTLFGCISGFVAGMVLVTYHEASFPLVGNPLPLAFKVIGVLLATGTGGNLSSYIGASIDIVTGEKTLFDLCYKKGKKEDLVKQSPSQLSSHAHFPFITSNEPQKAATKLPKKPTLNRSHSAGNLRWRGGDSKLSSSPHEFFNKAIDKNSIEMKENVKHNINSNQSDITERTLQVFQKV